MPRSFNLRELSLPTAASLKAPKSLVQIGLALLLFANLVAAAFAFHVFGASPESLHQQLDALRAQAQNEQARLNRSRMLTANIEKGKTEGEAFLAKYMTSRRRTYSTIISEITETAKTAGMKTQDWTIGIEPIEGSADLDMMTISINLQGGPSQLIKLVNLIDRSNRFLVIEGMQTAPQPNGNVLNVNLRLDTFVKDDTGGES